MGVCKPLLPLGNETILRAGILTMIEAGASPIVVVTGREAEAVRDSIDDLGVCIVHNAKYEETQMFYSVRLGLAALKGRCSRILFAPADAPLYSLETVRKLMQDPSDACVPCHNEETGHPVCFSADLIDPICRYEGDGGLRGALDSLCERKRIECDDPGAFMDADTPEEYEAMKRYYAGVISD